MQTRLATKRLNKLVGTGKAARFLGVSKYTLYSWTSAEKIPFRKVGASLRFDLEELDNWTRSNVAEPEPSLFSDNTEISRRLDSLEKQVRVLQEVIRLRSSRPAPVLA